MAVALPKESIMRAVPKLMSPSACSSSEFAADTAVMDNFVKRQEWTDFLCRDARTNVEHEYSRKKKWGQVWK